VRRYFIGDGEMNDSVPSGLGLLDGDVELGERVEGNGNGSKGGEDRDGEQEDRYDAVEVASWVKEKYECGEVSVSYEDEDEDKG
jgi:hypothetical protein